MIHSLRIGLIGAVIAAASSSAAFAHHPFASRYDAEAPVIVKGSVTKVVWGGDHVLIHVKTADKSWVVEAAPRAAMKRSGLDEASLGKDDEVTIRGYQSKDKSCTPECSASGADITFSDGLKVTLRDAPGQIKSDAAKVHDQRVAARAKLQ